MLKDIDISNKKIKGGLLIIIMRPKASLTYCYVTVGLHHEKVRN